MKQNLNHYFQTLSSLQLDLDKIRYVADSRLVQKGDVFVALKGENTDGHFFVNQAFEKGASLAIVKSDYSQISEKIFRVEDPYAFLRELASYKLKTYKPTTIGITGSCGKTTTKHFLEAILKAKFSVFSTPGNYNSQIGLPLALASLKKDQNIAVLEMGMSHMGDILKLREWIDLDYAIVTSIGLAHAENFHDQDIGISKAKAEILKGNPKAFFNQKTAEYEVFQAASNYKILSTKEINIDQNGVSFCVDQKWLGPFKTTIDAPYLLENLHLAIALAISLGMTQEEIQKGLSYILPFEKRLSTKKIQNIEFIDDSYNASPTSMRGAITYLKQKNAKRKIAIIGSMRELGVVSLREHLQLASDLKEGIDLVICIGEETKPIVEALKEKAFFMQNLSDIIACLDSELKEGDLVLIKGSHSTKLYELFELYKKKKDDELLVR